MKRFKVLSIMLASAIMLSACASSSPDEEAASTDAVAEQTAVETEATQTETEPSETEVSETEAQIVEITAENFFDTDPHYSEWANSGEAGDIIDLVDMDYLVENFHKDDDSTYGIFEIDSPEDLASFTYFVNVYPQPRTAETGNFFCWAELASDLDLSGYNWAPLGVYSDDHSHAFRGIFAGDGHTISGLTIDNDRDDNAFFGDTYSSSVFGLTIEDAVISGAQSAVFVYSPANTNMFDCHADGQAVDNEYAPETMFCVISTDEPNRYIDCTYNVAGSSGEYYVSEEPITMNPYGEGSRNTFLEFIDPEGDGTYEYTDNIFYDSGWVS